MYGISCKLKSDSWKTHAAPNRYGGSLVVLIYGICLFLYPAIIILALIKLMNVEKRFVHRISPAHSVTKAFVYSEVQYAMFIA